MSVRVCITGVGIVSALGMNKEETLHAIQQSRTGISDLSLLPTHWAGKLPAAEVKFRDEELKSKLGLESSRVYSRTSLLALHAIKEAIENAGLNSSEINSSSFVSATSVGGMDKGEIYYRDYLNAPATANVQMASVHDCGESTQVIANYFGIQNHIATISTACSSAANALIYGSRLIKSGRAKVVIAGGADALCRFTINGFNSLMILSDEPTRPFDRTRKGLNLGEGAGYVILESLEAAKERGAKVWCELSGYGNACDAYHQTASSPEGEGAYRSMNEALTRAGLEARDITYINAHGTGTPNNDLSESVALKRIFGEEVPDFSSTKSMTGHTLAAAGGIEAVLSAIALREGLVFPNLNFSEAIEETGLIPVVSLKKANLQHVLSNSFGFGGNNSSLIFSKCD
jgi:3-oxoacyl-(acyl-carrier-protein) synthase